MDKENILLEALNKYGDFKTVTQEFTEDQLASIYYAMELASNTRNQLIAAYKEGFDAATATLIGANKVVQEKSIK